MNTTDLIARVRRNAYIRDNHPEYNDQTIIDELNDALRAIYEGFMTKPRQGNWLKQYTVSSTVNQDRLRLTSRAVVGGLEKLEIGEVGDQLYPLTEVVENHAQLYETFGNRTGRPQFFVFRGDSIEFLPAFDHVMSIRVTYYVKPSLLATTLSNITQIGLINDVTNKADRVIAATLVASITNRYLHIFDGAIAPVGSTLTTGYRADVIRIDGNCELQLVSGVLSSVSGNILTFAAPADLTDVQLGDYVRFENETEWPPLPEEFHRTLADAASVKIMLQLNMSSKARDIAASVESDLARLADLISMPRTKSQPKRIPLQMVTAQRIMRSIWPRYP